MTLSIQSIYDYAKLSTISYVDLSSESNCLPETIIRVASQSSYPGNSSRIPETLGFQTLDPSGSIPADITGKWTVLDPTPFNTSPPA